MLTKIRDPLISKQKTINPNFWNIPYCRPRPIWPAVAKFARMTHPSHILNTCCWRHHSYNGLGPTPKLFHMCNINAPTVLQSSMKLSRLTDRSQVMNCAGQCHPAQGTMTSLRLISSDQPMFWTIQWFSSVLN